MTIDEAIAREREKAKEIRENIIDKNNLEPYESYCIAMTARCAEEHEQFAEWLEELKAYREIGTVEGYKSAIECYTEEYTRRKSNEQYNKAVDDFVNRILEEGIIGLVQYAKIKEISEQLKEGGSIGNL